MVILAFLPMGMERLLPTGKQRFVCDRFFQGEIAWGGGGIFMDASKIQKKEKRKKKTTTTTTKTNKQTKFP